MPIQLQGFNGDALMPLGKIQLPVTLRGDHDACAFKHCTFVVVDCPTAYNAILGRPVLIDFGAITSIRHLCLKFPCDNGRIGTLWGDQRSARSCYNVSIRSVYTVQEAIVAAPLAEDLP